MLYFNKFKSLLRSSCKSLDLFCAKILLVSTISFAKFILLRCFCVSLIISSCSSFCKYCFNSSPSFFIFNFSCSFFIFFCFICSMIIFFSSYRFFFFMFFSSSSFFNPLSLSNSIITSNFSSFFFRSFFIFLFNIFCLSRILTHFAYFNIWSIRFDKSSSFSLHCCAKNNIFLFFVSW